MWRVGIHLHDSICRLHDTIRDIYIIDTYDNIKVRFQNIIIYVYEYTCEFSCKNTFREGNIDGEKGEVDSCDK